MLINFKNSFPIGTLCDLWNAPSVCLYGAHYKSLLLLFTVLDSAVNLQYNRWHNISHHMHLKHITTLLRLLKLLLWTCSTFSKLCPSSGKRTGYSLIMVLILMAHTVVTCWCWLSSYCLSCVRSLASALFFSMTELLEIAVCNGRETPAFISPDMWIPAVHIWTKLTTEFGERRRSGCTRRQFMTLMNWSSVCCWELGLEQSVINGAEWHIHFCACIRAI